MIWKLKKIVAQPSIKNDMWVPYSDPGDKEYSVTNYFDFDDSIKTVFMRTFNEYLYPRIITDHAELFKKNFKILDKYFRNDFISEGIVQTEPNGYRIFVALMKKNLNKILVHMRYFGHVIVIQIRILNWQCSRR